MKLRNKLMVGFGGMLIVLLIEGGLSLRTIHDYNLSLQRLFQSNYKSWEFCREMRTASTEINLLVSQALWDPTINDISVVGPDFKHFEENLKLLNENEFIVGEKTLVDEVGSHWRNYRGNVEHFFDPGLSREARQQLYLSGIDTGYHEVMEAVLRVATLNLNEMAMLGPNSEKRLSDVQYALVFLLSFGAALSAAFLALIGRFILQPIESMRSSVAEIEQGNLDIAVSHRSGDEIGELADAFNSMTSKMREMRRTEKDRFERTQRTTQLAIDSLRDAIILFDHAGVIEVSNSMANRLFGLQPGQKVDEVNKPWLQEIVAGVRDTKKPHFPKGYDSIQQVFDEGEEHFFLPNAVPILNQEGDLTGITMVLADVTGLRRLDELKSGLISTASHELKTPLTSMRMALYILTNQKFGNLNERQMDLVTTARNDCDRLFRTIHDLLDISRIQAGRYRLDIQSINLRDLILDGVKPFVHQFAEAGMIFETRIAENLPSARIDPGRINIVLANLLNNALKYCRHGDRVTLEAEVENDQTIRLRVSDTGPGIESGYTDKIFEKFFRAPHNAKGGAGLGLAITRDIIEAHGGTINCRSGLGEGMTFDIALPISTDE